jgi:hypothetical protein
VTGEVDVVRAALVAGQVVRARIEYEVVLAGFSSGDDVKAHHLCPSGKTDEQAWLIPIHGRNDPASLLSHSLEFRADHAVEFLRDERQMLPGLDGDKGMPCRSDGLSGRFDDNIDGKFDRNCEVACGDEAAAVPGSFCIGGRVADLDSVRIDAGGFQSCSGTLG